MGEPSGTTLSRSFSARSDRTVDVSLDEDAFAGLSEYDEVEAVEPVSGAPRARHGRRAGRAADEMELAEETLDLSASFDQLDTSQLEMEAVRPAASGRGPMQQLALDEVQAAWHRGVAAGL